MIACCQQRLCYSSYDLIVGTFNHGAPNLVKLDPVLTTTLRLSFQSAPSFTSRNAIPLFVLVIRIDSRIQKQHVVAFA